MNMAFSKRSGMIRVATINRDLLFSLWRGIKKQKDVLKFLLIIPVLFYSTICLFLMIFFYIASVIDVIPFIISWIACTLSSLAQKISKKKYGAFATLFYPPIVFLVGIMMVLAVLLPKAVVMPQD